MTTRRLIASLTASAAALALAATFAVRSFPLEAQGRRPPAPAAPIQVVREASTCCTATLPEYPRRAIEQKFEGDVVVDLTLNDRGEVSDARVLSGPEELRKATLEAVLQWHYSPSAVRSTVTQATLRFQLPAEGLEMDQVKTYAMEGRAWAFKAPQHAEGPLKEIEMALENPALTDEQRVELKAKYVEMKVMREKIAADIELVENGKARELEVKSEPKLLEFSGGENVTLKFIDPKSQLKRDVRRHATARASQNRACVERDGQGVARAGRRRGRRCHHRGDGQADPGNRASDGRAHLSRVPERRGRADPHDPDALRGEKSRTGAPQRGRDVYRSERSGAAGAAAAERSEQERPTGPRRSEKLTSAGGEATMA